MGNLDQDDDARDFRAILEESQAQLSIIADEPLDVTQRLLLTSINVNLSLAIALGRQTGILGKKTTSVGTNHVPSVYLQWSYNNGLGVVAMRDALRHMARQVPDWRMKKILAIKDIRATTNLGLKESKDLADLTTQYPEFDDWWE